MLKVSEVRVDNFISMTCDGKTFNTRIDIGDFMDIARGYKVIAGIPLTEEWLLKFGFETNTEKAFSFDGLLLMKGRDGYVAIDCNLRYVLKYVHQLQNLYFTLTGEEIEINQNTPTTA